MYIGRNDANATNPGKRHQHRPPHLLCPLGRYAVDTYANWPGWAIGSTAGATEEQDYTGNGALVPGDPNTVYISTQYDPRDASGATTTHLA